MSVAGRHLLQIPGPTNVPLRVRAAIAEPTMDHRGPAFAELAGTVLTKLRQVFKTAHPVVIFPSSGTGAWEAALVNTLSPGDQVLMPETGHFAALWREVAQRLGLEPVVIEGDWRRGAGADAVAAALRADTGHSIRAVCVVHNETSTGATSDVAAVRAAMDDAAHPALLMVDTISSLASIDYRHDEWGADVAVGASQKGLMLPPGLSFNVVGPRALEAHKAATLPRSYWDWGPMLSANAGGFFPFTPATNLIVGLSVALNMLIDEEGLDEVFARHARLAEATRRTVEGWGLEIVCMEPTERSNSLTAVLMPDGADADELRKIILQRFNVSLGNGLGRLKGRVFRIGHLGDFNELMLAGTLCGVEMGLGLAGVPHKKNGIGAALDYLAHGGNAAPR
jgi:alanine-glyoxylate transaminase/serine-glyoxylate transaminase/serine-pyruvate transaminase